MKLLYFMRDRVVSAPPPGVAGLLSGNMIPCFLDRGVDVVLCARGSLLSKEIPIKHDLKTAIDYFKPDIIYNLVAEMQLYGMEHYIKQKKIPYVGDATHGKFIPEESMRGFDFICQSRLLYKRISEKHFRAHHVRPFVPRTELPDIVPDNNNKPILYLHNGDKGIDRSIRICEKIGRILRVTIAEIPKHIQSSNVRRYGCVDVDTKKQLILESSALIYTPPDNGFIEATCTSAMECLLSGLPIIGVPNRFGREMCVFQYIKDGNIPSIICDTENELITKLNNNYLSLIERKIVKSRAEEYFDQNKSIDDYMRVFNHVIQNKG